MVNRKSTRDLRYCATTNSVTFEKTRIFKILRLVVRRFIASLRKSYNVKLSKLLIV